MSIIKEAKKIGVLVASALVLSYAGYASSSNAGNKNSEIEKLIKQQYNNENYDCKFLITSSSCSLTAFNF